MKIIISSHIDTVFNQPYAIFRQGILTGANDNFASTVALGRIMDDPVWESGNLEIQFTEDEEMYMDGAATIARRNNPKDTLIIVLDVTGVAGKHSFTIENIHEVKTEEIKKALKNFKGKYKIIKDGTESEAWLYAEKGFSVIEVDIPVRGGIHSLNSTSKVVDHRAVADAVLALIYYFKDKDISAIRSEDD